ncbi:MAG: AAA family ATPase [Firmicutes bacterium]|nr:AAA family ATPase [Bacillota bacterium]
MADNQSELTWEKQRLAQTIALVKKQLNQAKLDNEGNSSEIISLKQEMSDQVTHSVSNLWYSQNFEDLVELSQYNEPIIQKIADYEQVANRIARLERLLNAPYFARIDFKFDDGDADDPGAFEKIYLGRSSLVDDEDHEIYIYDWRSPIASMFYRFTTGPAFYEAPLGTITGVINLKRQYEIKNGALEYFFDAEVQIIDAFLRKLLARNTSPQMKTIVETIQKEQDLVIRDMENELMMVQGVAGSGKTSIALHRAAYLMYQGLSSSKLTAANIIIVSPNTVFEHYIANVLPELGEDNVVSVVWEEILMTILPNQPLQAKNEFLELLITGPREQNIMQKSIECKTSPQFITILNRFIDNLPHQWIDLDVAQLYANLVGNEQYFCSLTEGLALPDAMEDILKLTQKNLNSPTLYYDDAAVLAFLKLKLNGISEYKNIKQVVIDEAQDYYPLHYELFNLLFPHAKYTVLGDISQTLEKQEDLSLYEQISKILHKKKSTLVIMDKSFRCTNEILHFSSRFISPAVAIKSFNRAGYEPQIHIADDQPFLRDMIIAEIEFCLAEGYQSIGLICKTEKNSLALFNLLSDKMPVRIIKDESTADLQGVFIIPVYMAKGLEFDAVLICDANEEHYYHANDRKFLYIACTRALHRLNLYCPGTISPLLNAFSSILL